MAAAIDIFKDYPKDKYNPLIPVCTVTQLSPLHKMAVNIVQLSADPSEGDVFELNGGRSIAKKGLMKMMAAANIQIVEIKKIPPSTCEKCLEMARATGKPSTCSTCLSKDDVAYEATLSVPDPAGGSRQVRNSREFICADEKARMYEKQYNQAFPFRGAITESKAINRAIRAALMIKTVYSAAELQKPFAVPIVVPDATDPEMKAAMLERFRNGADQLYLARPELPALGGGRMVTSIEGDDDALDAAVDAEFSMQVTEMPEGPSEPERMVCDECQVEIVAFKTPKKEWTVDEWLSFSRSKYKAQLCPKCAAAHMKGAA